MKLVHVIGAMAAGGAERFVTSLISKFKAGGIDVALWVLSNRSDAAGKDMMRKLTEAGVPYAIGPTSRVGWKSVLWYARLLERERPAIVHLHTSNTELAHFLGERLALKGWSRRGGVLIRTLHDTQPPVGQLKRRVYRANRAHWSIACGAATAAAYSEIVTGMTTRILNGVDFSGPVISRNVQNVARQRLGLDNARVHFVHVGRMEGETLNDSAKAHNILLEAWHLSELGRQANVLHLLGGGNLRAALEELSGGDPSIRFHGVRDDVETWLQAADCFVMPSRFEGLPIAGIEAIGAGLPCIFSDIPPLRELSPPLVRWFAADDPQSLAIELRRMASKPDLPPMEATLAFRNRYSISRAAKQYEDIYQKYGLNS